MGDVTNYFAVGLDVFPFDDTDPSSIVRAYAEASKLETDRKPMRVWRRLPEHSHLCSRVVGVTPSYIA